MLADLDALLIRPGMTGIGGHASNLVETLALAEEPGVDIDFGCH